jgi:hypothetical protein
MRIQMLVLLAVFAAGSAEAAPITYEFSTVRTVAPGPLGPTGRVMRANPSGFTPGPTGRFSYDADTGVFTLSFQGAVFASSSPVVDLSDSAPVNVVGDLNTLEIDFGVPAVQTPFTTDTGYTIVSFFPLQLLLAGPGLFTGGVLGSGLLDASFTDAAFGVGHVTSPGQGGCIPDTPFCPNPTTENTKTTWAMIGLHQVPEPSVIGLALLAAVLVAQTIRPARASV